MNSRAPISSSVTTPSHNGWRGVVGGKPGSASGSSACAALRMCSLVAPLTLVAVVALAACSSSSIEDSDGLATQDVSVSSDTADPTDPSTTAVQSPDLKNSTAVPAPQGDSTTVPAPQGSGDGAEGTVPFTPIVTSAPVGFDEPSDFGTGLTVEISKAETANVVAALPGELGGPSVILTLEFSNSSGTPIDLNRTTVDLSFGDGVPGVPMTTPPSNPVVGSLAPDTSAFGNYVFSVPEDQLSRIVVTVKYSADAPTAVLEGSLEQ